MPMAHATPRPVSAGFRAAKSKRSETADRGQSREQNRFRRTSYVMLDVVRFADQHDVDSVINADGEHEAE